MCEIPMKMLKQHAIPKASLQKGAEKLLKDKI